MLKVFREKRDSLKWILWLLIVVLGAGMVLFFVDTPTGQSSGLFTLEIARVRDQSIGVSEFRRQQNQLVGIYRQQLGENFEEFVDQLNIPGQTVNSLVTEYSIASHALDMGLVATDSELREVILSFGFKDEEGMFVGADRYTAILQANNLTVSEFEGNIRRGILRDKLRHLITFGLSVSPEDLRREFGKQEQQTRLNYVVFDPARISPNPSQKELKQFFEANPDDYREKEQRQIQYFDILLQPDKINLDEEQVLKRMESVGTQERIRASQILFKTKPNQDDPKKRKLAGRVLRQLKKGADFAVLAHRYSEDESSSRGGDLGFFPRGVRDEKFDKVAFNLKVGELSKVVQTPFGYHIIKVTSKPSETGDVKRVLAEYQLREEFSKEQSRVRALDLLGRLKNEESWEEISVKEDLEIKTTGLFPREEPPSIPQVRDDFNIEAFNLGRDEHFSKPYLTPTGYIVAGLKTIQAPQLPEFETVVGQVKEDFIAKMKMTETREQANKFFSAARQNSIQEAARNLNFNMTTTRFFKNGETVDDVLKFSPMLHERIVWMKPGDISPPITVSGKLLVFEVVKKTDQDKEIFESRKDQIETTLIESARNNFFNGYIKNVVDRLRENEQIQINQELLAEFSNN